MEALLSLSFDNITSSSPVRIRKGLRQIEGLLAQICLSRNSSQSPMKRRASVVSIPSTSLEKKLGSLIEDPAYREFWRLQESFEWNVASRVVSCLEKLLGMRNNEQVSLLTASSLSILQGLLLLHPPSRTLFSRDVYMILLFDLLEPTNTPQIQAHALLVLVAALLACPLNARCFERNDGLLAISSLFKSRATSQDVKLRVVEFLYFYLMPEAPAHDSATAPAPEHRRRSRRNSEIPDRRTHSGGSGGISVDLDSDTAFAEVRNTTEKTKMLSRYLPNVEELVADLREDTPFSGGVPISV